MIELIHKHPILIKALLTLVTVAFIGTGGWMLGRESKYDYAAKVNGQKISLQEYDDYTYKLEEFYRKVYQGGIPPELMKRLNISKKSVEALVEKAILLQEAGKQGIEVTDKEVSEAVTGNRSFQDESGRFSKDRYTRLLSANGMTPAMYERTTREDLAVERLKRMVKDAVYLTEDEVRAGYKDQLAQQGKPFTEEGYQKQKDEAWRSQNLAAQERLFESYKAGLKKQYKVEINPQILAKS